MPPLLRPPGPDQAQLTAAEAAADKQAGQGGDCFSPAAPSAACTCLGLLKSIRRTEKAGFLPRWSGEPRSKRPSLLCLAVPLPPPRFPGAEEEDGDGGAFPRRHLHGWFPGCLTPRFGSAGAGWESSGCSSLRATSNLRRLDGG